MRSIGNSTKRTWITIASVTVAAILGNAPGAQAASSAIPPQQGDVWNLPNNFYELSSGLDVLAEGSDQTISAVASQVSSIQSILGSLSSTVCRHDPKLGNAEAMAKLLLKRLERHPKSPTHAYFRPLLKVADKLANDWIISKCFTAMRLYESGQGLLDASATPLGKISLVGSSGSSNASLDVMNQTVFRAVILEADKIDATFSDLKVTYSDGSTFSIQGPLQIDNGTPSNPTFFLTGISTSPLEYLVIDIPAGEVSRVELLGVSSSPDGTSGSIHIWGRDQGTGLTP